MPQLVFYRDNIEVLRFPMQDDQIRLGRHPDNDISLPDPHVSRHHAVIIKNGSDYLLRNLSRVGTQIDGKNIDEVSLHDHDCFKMGSWRVLYEESLAHEASKTAWTRSDTTNHASDYYGLVGKSSCMKSVVELIEVASAGPLAVMIQGETGTGKEVVARALHRASQCRGAFVAINCSAISESLIESELFGHERGAFTGAMARHKGAFEQASGGTLFLDEIGELPLSLQPKLLRVLEDGSFRRVGGSDEIHSDARVVAATHRDLHDETKKGRFREDLFYRLMGVPIHLPPLRERAEDIPLLAEHFLHVVTPGKQHKSLSSSALKCLQNYPWEGNVRELKNVLARSILLCRKSVLEAEDIRFLETGRERQKKPFSLEGAEREAIVEALRACHGNKLQAARKLGIAKSTLFRKLKDHHI